MNAQRTLLLAVGLGVSGAASETTLGQVEQAWLDRFNGVANRNDWGKQIAMDAAGAIYVAGTTFQEIQPNYFIPRFLTIRYDADGTRTWTRTWPGGFDNGAASVLAVDGAGDVIVGGGLMVGDDWAVIKYDAAGTELWTSIIDANSGFMTEPEDIEIDASNNIYLTGTAETTVSIVGIVVYDPAGTFQWGAAYDGPTDAGSSGSALAVDAAGNVYVVGSTMIDGLSAELSLLKFDATGQLQWLRTLGTPGAVVAGDRGTDIAIDGAGDIVVTGYVSFNWITSVDVVTAKYDTAGHLLWSVVYDSPFGQDDFGSRLAIDSQDDIVVIGYSEVGFNDYDALTLKYDSGGNLQWAERYASIETHVDFATSVALDGNDNIYVVGEIDPIGGSHYFTVKYDPSGQTEWEQLYAGQLGDFCTAWDVVVSPDGSVYVTGASEGFGTGDDAVTIKYTQAAPGDLDGDGAVGILDFLALLAAWGPCPPVGECAADLDGDGVVGIVDMLTLLANWG